MRYYYDSCKENHKYQLSKKWKNKTIKRKIESN